MSFLPHDMPPHVRSTSTLPSAWGRKSRHHFAAPSLPPGGANFRPDQDEAHIWSGRPFIADGESR